MDDIDKFTWQAALQKLDGAYVLPTLGTLGQLIRRGAQLPYIECNPRKNTVARESRQ